VKRLVAILSLLLAASASAGETLKLVAERQSLLGTWRTYRQVIDGLEVYGTDVIERVDAGGNAHELHRTMAHAAAHRPLIAATEARTHLPAGRVAAQQLVALNVGGEARPAWRVVVEERPMEPVAHFVDAANGALLRSEPLFWTVKGRVFDVNPVAKLNRPDLQDQNNAASAVPAEAYSDVELDNLAASGPLIGPNVTIVDTEAPFTIRADAGQPLLFDRSQPQFEEVNAYFQLDRAQKYLQSLGYSGPRRIVGYSIPVDPHAANGGDNSYYTSNGDGTGGLFFGDGGTDDAEDSDIMLHEYGHAIQDWIAPGAFNGESSSQSRAMGEGFGDYWSFSSTYDLTIVSGRDPYCIGDWDARCARDLDSEHCAYALNADCLRRVDSTKTMANFIISDAVGTEHRNGEIWSSALREIFLSAGKRATDTIVLEATFGVPPNPTYAGMAQRILEADRALYGGAHAAAICGAMTSRGILADCRAMPRLELTAIQSPAHGLPLPATASVTVTDTRAIDRLFVHVDVRHPSRGDLQIILAAPDGTTVALQRPSLDRNPDLDATFGVDVEAAESLSAFNGKSAAGTWTLTVTDTRGSGVGTLVSWSLLVQFAGDLPRDVRPFSFAPRQHIAAIAHTDGIGGSQWRSDVFLFNKAQTTAMVTMLFTPSGANGATNFGGVIVEVAPQQVVVFRDVLAQLFRATGGGTMELQGDVGSLLAWSRTVDASRHVSETIESMSSTDAAQATYLFPIDAGFGGRTNVGIIETAGESGIAHLSFYPGDFAVGSDAIAFVDVPLAPFTHVQFPATPLATWAHVSVEGAARIEAYASVIDGSSGDPTFIPQRTPVAMDAVLPVVANNQWETHLRIGNVASFVQPVVGQTPFPGSIFFSIPAGVLVSSRIEKDGVGDRVDPVPLSEAISDSADLIRIEQDAAYRTNLGATEVDGIAALVRFTLFDASGHMIGSIDKFLVPHQQLQFSLREITSATVVDGRVRVAVLGGRVVAYASVVDNTSSDSEFVRAR